MPLVVLIVVMGVFPQFFLSRMESSVDKFIKDFHERAVIEKVEAASDMDNLFQQVNAGAKTGKKGDK